MEIDIEKLKLEIESFKKDKIIKIDSIEKEFYKKVADALLQSKLLSKLNWKYNIITVRDKKGNRKIGFYLSYQHQNKHTALSIIKILGFIKNNAFNEINLTLKEGVILESCKNQFKITFSSPEIGVKFIEEESLMLNYVELVTWLKQVRLIK